MGGWGGGPHAVHPAAAAASAQGPGRAGLRFTRVPAPLQCIWGIAVAGHQSPPSAIGRPLARPPSPHAGFVPHAHAASTRLRLSSSPCPLPPLLPAPVPVPQPAAVSSVSRVARLRRSLVTTATRTCTMAGSTTVSCIETTCSGGGNGEGGQEEAHAHRDHCCRALVLRTHGAFWRCCMQTDVKGVAGYVAPPARQGGPAPGARASIILINYYYSHRC